MPLDVFPPLRSCVCVMYDLWGDKNTCVPVYIIDAAWMGTQHYTSDIPVSIEHFAFGG